MDLRRSASDKRKLCMHDDTRVGCCLLHINDTWRLWPESPSKWSAVGRHLADVAHTDSGRTWARSWPTAKSKHPPSRFAASCSILGGLFDAIDCGPLVFPLSCDDLSRTNRTLFLCPRSVSYPSIRFLRSQVCRSAWYLMTKSTVQYSTVQYSNEAAGFQSVGSAVKD